MLSYYQNSKVSLSEFIYERPIDLIEYLCLRGVCVVCVKREKIEGKRQVASNRYR